MRRTLEWLAPGLGLKRWLLLAFAGGVLLVYSVIFGIGVLWSPQLMRGLGMGWLENRHWAALLLAVDGAAVGLFCLLYGGRRVWLFQKTTPESASEIRAAGRMARGPRVVAVGGGNGLAALLRGLKSHTSNLTAVVTMADDGGSSGLLRRDMGMPPPGDLRNCLVALADDESMMSQLFKYRFPEDTGLQGHSFGNLFITALAEVTGDFEHAVREATHVLKVRGRVLPSTLDDVVLHAQLEGGDRVSGESSITAAERLPRRVWLTPEAPRGVPQAVAAIARADLVVLGPGSLYTSVIPNALVPEVREALADYARPGRLRVQRDDPAGGDRRLHRRRPPGRAAPPRAGRHHRRDPRQRPAGLRGHAAQLRALRLGARHGGRRAAQGSRRQGRPRADRRRERRGAPRLRAPRPGAPAPREVAMGFTRDVKLELVTVMPVAEHCRRAQLSGLLFGTGTFELGSGGHFGVRVSVAHPALARHVLSLLKPLQVEAQLRTVDSAPVGLRYEVLVGDEGRGLQVLNELGVISDQLAIQMTVPRRLVERHCCLVAFLRGLFLGCGSVSAPGAPVHVEFTVEDEDLAAQVQRFLGRLELPFSLMVRERNVACYSKRGQTAADLLAILGAHDSCLRWEEHAVLGTVRESANRLANCDAANARRAASAGVRQAALLSDFMETAAWRDLPAQLREVAELRIEYPYLSLAELAELTDPPLSRSALNHRLRRLVALALETAG